MYGLLLLSAATFGTPSGLSGSAAAQEASPEAANATSASVAQAAAGDTAEADQAKENPNLIAFQASAQAFVDAFNKADAAAVANLWTEEGEYVDAAGDVFTGRAAIEQAYAAFFSANQGATLRIHIESFKLLGDTVAREEGSTVVEAPPALAAVGMYTAIHVKVEGKWLLASVRDTLTSEAVAAQNLTDLDWLVGTWVAEEHGNRAESVCRWVGKQGFVQRSFTNTLFDGTQSSGVQMIGWNPQAGVMQSWTFNADGGHAIGVWMPTDQGWAAETQGMTGDGIPTTSTNVLRRLDDNAYVWQSFNRTLGGVAVADSDEVVIKRQPTSK